MVLGLMLCSSDSSVQAAVDCQILVVVIGKLRAAKFIHDDVQNLQAEMMMERDATAIQGQHLTGLPSRQTNITDTCLHQLC
jgi:hypothetical protein